MRFIEEWAHPLIKINFTLIGLSSGLVLGCALAGLCENIAMVQAARPWALIVSLLAWPPLALSLRRNAGCLHHKSALQCATGIPAKDLEQKSVSISAGIFTIHASSFMARSNSR